MSEPTVPVSELRRLLDLYGERDMGVQARWAFYRLCGGPDSPVRCPRSCRCDNCQSDQLADHNAAGLS